MIDICRSSITPAYATQPLHLLRRLTFSRRLRALRQPRYYDDIRHFACRQLTLTFDYYATVIVIIFFTGYDIAALLLFAAALKDTAPPTLAIVYREPLIFYAEVSFRR